jgi:threonine dehydratase
MESMAMNQATETTKGETARAGTSELERMRGRIQEVERLIRPHIRRTPAVEVAAADFGLAGEPIVLKLELLQHAGSFKARGACANLLLREVPSAGVVAASGGNHGAAVAWAARARGVPAKIFVPKISSPAKVQRIRGLRRRPGDRRENYGEALAASEIWARDTRRAPRARVRPGRDDRRPGLGRPRARVAVPRPRHGACRRRGRRAHLRHRVVVPRPRARRRRRAGRRSDAHGARSRRAARSTRPSRASPADSLAPTRVGERTYAIASRAVERVVLVSDDDIREARRALWRGPARRGRAGRRGGALGGPCRDAIGPVPDEKIAVVVSGGNTVLTGLDEP